MTPEAWNKLDIREQMSNIHGEVVRLIRAGNNYKQGRSSEDYTGKYFDAIVRLIELTEKDPKNARRIPELESEKEEIRNWLEGGLTDDYILRYWDDYTRAISV